MRVASGNNPSLHAETAYSTPCGYIQTILYAKATGYLGLGVHPEALVQHTLEEGNQFDLKDVSNIPFSGVFSIYYESSKTPSYITVSSKH
ncbi:hypothetical protein [uncultured Akkermansia sp.]|uniref:hypothetical protein n=1 Tax=uncultured Akkermansia sp. TaxID=512294 RepID=UPI0025975D97|nr:hypothetical protein [uncultured Akkermansia sp.]